MRVTYLKLIAGAACLLVATAVLFSSKSIVIQSNTTHAQSGQGYTTDWSATKAIAVKGWKYFDGGAAFPDIALGVAEWQVTVKDAGTQATMLTETWQTPQIGDVTYNTSTMSLSGAGFNSADWIFVNHVATDGGNPRNPVYSIKPLSSLLNPTYTFSKDNARVGGNAVRCIGGTDSNCIYPTGPYAYEVYHSLSNIGSERGRITSSGIMMPLKWTVTGTIY